MAITLPTPSSPHAAPPRSPQVRAYRCWQAGQDHADRLQWPLAASAYERAAALRADPAYELAAAHALIKAGRPADAVPRAQRVRRQQPNEATTSTLATTLCAHALYLLGRDDEVIACVESAPADAPRDQLQHVLYGLSLQRCRRHLGAISAFLNALALKLDDAVTHFRLGMSFKDMGMKSEAAECVRTAVLLGLGSSEVAGLGLIAFFEREACRWPEAALALENVRAAVAKVPAHTALETSPFTHVVLLSDPAEQLKATTHYALHVAQGIRPMPRVKARSLALRERDAQGRPQQRRLKVGYLSADFHFHATAQLMVQMLECHDRSRFEVFLLSTGADDRSAMRARVVASSEHFVELHQSSFKQIAQRIRELGIDLLVDLKGGTSDTLFPALAYRPAPLQATWLGFPGSSGAPFIDYVIGDPIVTPLAHAPYFSEHIAQLPRCYQPNDARRARPQPSARADWGLPERSASSTDGAGLVLCGFHQSFKISAEVFDTWCDLMLALPGATLWLLRWNTNVQAALEQAAEARGIAKCRLVFAVVVPIEQHLTRLAQADIFLDAWPCNAHTTAGEALWAGVPVVTLTGPAFIQRVAASLLHAVALDELVCESRDAYRSTVLALAHDAPRRAQLHRHLLAQREHSALFDGATVTREVEALYYRMWQRAVDGVAPDHLPAVQGPAVQAPAAQNLEAASFLTTATMRSTSSQVL